MSFTVTTNVSLVFAVSALIAEALATKVYAPEALVTVSVPYVPTNETVVPPSVPLAMP